MTCEMYKKSKFFAQRWGLQKTLLRGRGVHTCAWGGFLGGGDQLPIPTRYKISAKSRGLYTCNVKVLAIPPPPRPLMVAWVNFYEKKPDFP